MKFKKQILIILFSQIISFHYPVPVAAQELEEVVTKFTIATYGEAGLESINSIRVFGFIHDENGLPNYYILYEAELPNMKKIEYFKIPNDKGYEFSYDGEIGWELNVNADPVFAVRLSQKRSKALSEEPIIIEPFVQPEKIGLKVSLIGKKNYASKAYYEIIVNFKDGTSKGYYIDSNNYRLKYSGNIIATENSDASSEIKYSSFTHFQNYKEVNGIFFAFLEQQIFNIYSKTTTLEILRIEVNPEFSDNHFKMP